MSHHVGFFVIIMLLALLVLAMLQSDLILFTRRLWGPMSGCFLQIVLNLGSFLSLLNSRLVSYSQIKFLLS